MDSPMKILVVEDTLIAQMIMKTHLTQIGFEVDVASDGVTAIEKGLNNSYDLILMDIGLGNGPDGFETAISIKNKSKLNKDTPIMAVTAHSGTEYEVKARDCGMVGYFKKPFKPADAEIIMAQLKNKK